MDRLIKLAKNPWLLAFVAALTIYTLVGFSLVPFLVQHYTPKLAADLIQRQASVREVQFNPFLFTFEAKDLALNEADGKPVFGLNRLFLDFEPGRFITSRTIAFADLRLEGPAVNLVQDAEGKLNVVKIGESLPKSEEPPPPPSEEPPPRILLQHLALADGSVKFTDESKPAPVTESIEHLDLELNDFSTLPDRQGEYRIDAGLPDGGRLAWKGDVSLNPVASAGELKIESFKVATLWKFVKDRLALAEPKGEIGLGARYKFSHTKDKTELTVEDAGFKLAGLGLALADGKNPLLDLSEIGFEKAGVDLSAHTVHVPSFAIRKGRIHAATDEAGRIDWLGVVKPEPANAARKPAPPAPPPDKAPPGPPWKVKVDKFEIAEIGLDYADASRKGPFTVSVGDFGLDLAAEAEAGAGAPKAKVDGLVAHVDRVALAQPGRAVPLLGWDTFKVEGGQMDLEKQEAAIQRAVLKGGGTAVVRDADGTLHPIDIFEPKSGPVPAPATEEKPAEKKIERFRVVKAGTSIWDRWRFALGEFALQDFGVALTDRSFSPELAYNLDDIQVSAKSITNDGTTPVAFDTRLKVRQGGNLSVSGTASQKGDAAQAKIRIDRFDLKQLQSIVSRFAALKLEGADLSTDLSVDFKQAEPKPSVKASGKVDLNGLKLVETKDGSTFLAWKALGANGIDFSLAPDKLSVKEVRILKPDAAIHIYKDKSTNIQAIFKPQQPAPAPPAKAPAKPPARPEKAKPAGKTSQEPPFPVTVARVRVDDAEVDFSDESLVLPFATHISNFDGSVTGISLAPKSRATMQFAGKVGDYGEAKVDGTLSPMDIKNFSHIDVVFRNVAMPTLSPYSATFAGRKIQSGKLNLDLQYRIENGQLKSKNDIVLENFALGEHVESPSALDLPLDLAIALLTDNQGRIKASVPVEGDVDNPKFAYGKLVWDAFVTLITKVVTAPFNALASVFGGSEEKLDAVLFEPARDAISPPEREKLKKIAEGLSQRPKLKLTIIGRFNPKLDGEALKSLAVRRALAEKLGVVLKPGEEPDMPAFSDAATQRALEKLADERGGADAVQAEFLKETGRPPQRVGALAGLMGKASDTPEFYEKLFKHLVDATPLPPSELEALASRRGQAVMAELAEKDHVDRSRLALGKTEATEESAEGNVPTKLELGAE